MRRTLFVLVLLYGLVALTGVARAHASYKSSDPADRASVGSPPSRVTAEFTEPLAEGSYLRVTDPCGDRVDGGDVTRFGYEMYVSMSGSKKGAYTVAYRAFSQFDPHVVEGTFSFSVTGGEPCAGAQVEPPSEGDDSAPSEDTQGPSSQTGGPVLAQDGPEDSGPDPGSGGAELSRARSSGGSSRPPGREPIAAKVPNIAAPERRAEERETSVYDGIPMGSFAVSLLLAALIGAAGGKIYAGIMGPRA